MAKYSGIGGQAVMEGVMMRNGNKYAISVRKPDGEIVVEKKDIKESKALDTIKKIPFLRGVVAFVDSLYFGMNALTFSASFFEEETDSAPKTAEEEAKAKKKEKAELSFTLIISLILGIALFMVAPFYLSRLFAKLDFSETMIIVMEGIIKVVIFLGYMVGISFMEDIKRVYMYHGAEHKCINCIESGKPLTVENVRESTRLHKRCGTSFLFFVIIISVILFIFIRVDSQVLKIVIRLALIPVIAGISYEFIRLAGKSDNAFVSLLAKPGLWLQKLTTREPDDSMIEVGISSVEAVFDWKKYLEDNL